MVALVAIAALSGVAGSLWWQQTHRPALELATGTYLSSPRQLPDFSLIDQNNAPFSPANLRGHWTLMFFGYTNCPDFCPTTLVMLAALEKRLRAENATVRPQVVFVSVDAARDTPAQLARYVPAFDPSFLGVTAHDQAAIEALAARLGVAVMLEPKRADGGYVVDHSGLIDVIDPEGRIAAILTGPFTVPALEADLERIESRRA